MSAADLQETGPTEPDDPNNTLGEAPTQHLGPPAELSAESSAASRSSPDSQTAIVSYAMSDTIAPPKAGPKTKKRQREYSGQVGRFQLLSKLGAGAMGIVYAAYDPKLDRKVAIKLVDLSRVGTNVTDAQVSLEREARAAATLAHPNIVTVFDVGQHLDGAFMAMELVDGGTLRSWTREKPRSFREIIAMFIEIGQGLHAAHKHSLVHRDFKPGNVLVGKDGRPRIADFGLAAPVEGWTQREAEHAARSGEYAGEQRSVTLESTDDGRVCGTPAYMSPEQFCAKDIGPRSDQFAFAVALFEAIYGARPFRGRSLSALADAVLRHHVRIPKHPPHKVPKRLAQIIARGMAHDAADRYPDMGEFVDELEHFQGRRRKRIVVAAGGGLTAVALGLGYEAAAVQGHDPCEQVLEGVDELWSAEARTAAESSVAAANWAERWPTVEQTLDGYVATWSKQRMAACTATHVEQTQSPHAMQLQFACLDRAAISLEAVVGEHAEGTNRRIDPMDATALLLPLSQCTAIDELAKLDDGLTADGITADGDPTTLRPHIQAWRAISKARARMLFDRPGWQEQARDALALAEEHDLQRMQAWAKLLLGSAAVREGNPERAAALFRESVSLALSSSDTTLALSGMLRRAHTALELGQAAEAQIHLDYAAAAMPSVRDADAVNDLQRELVLVGGQTAKELGEFSVAVAKLSAAIKDIEATSWDRDPKTRGQLAALYGELGVAHKGAGAPQKSVDALEQALELFSTLGDVHPQFLGDTHHNLAVSYIQLRNFSEALARLQSARTLYVQAEAHPGILGTLESNWGWLERERGRLDAAVARQQKALQLYADTIGPDHPENAYPRLELAQVERQQGNLDEALEHATMAVQLRAGTLGPQHPETAFAQTILAWVRIDRGETDAAGEALRDAHAVFGADPKSNALDVATAEFVSALLGQATGAATADADLAQVERTLDQLGAPASGLKAELVSWRASSKTTDG